MELSGRVALVTGAARRVGRAIAVRLAQSGCNVAVHCLSSAQDAQATAAACRAAGSAAEVFAADLAHAAAATALVDAALARFGRLDILINNASIFEQMTLDSFTLADWERTLRINLTAPLALVHAARHALRAARGRVVNITDAAVDQPWPGHLAYMVSKGALETLTRLLARALAPEVNVVAVAPGVAAWPDRPEYDDTFRAHLTAKIPLGRPGSPQEIAAAVHFLLREGDFITGAVLPVDGGRHLT
jgi:pteridine reductase